MVPFLSGSLNFLSNQTTIISTSFKKTKKKTKKEAGKVPNGQPLGEGRKNEYVMEVGEEEEEDDDDGDSDRRQENNGMEETARLKDKSM